MPENKPKFSSEGSERLQCMQNSHLSKMLVDFHLQNLNSKKQRCYISEETSTMATHESSSAPKEADTRHSYKTSTPKNRRKKTYRNPLIYARELNQELLSGKLSRKQLAKKHGISSDRITQWLCLLKLPKKAQQEVTAMGDYWDKKKVTERQLRSLRLNL